MRITVVTIVTRSDAWCADVKDQHAVDRISEGYRVQLVGSGVAGLPVNLGGAPNRAK